MCKPAVPHVLQLRPAQLEDVLKSLPFVVPAFSDHLALMIKIPYTD